MGRTPPAPKSHSASAGQDPASSASLTQPRRTRMLHSRTASRASPALAIRSSNHVAAALRGGLCCCQGVPVDAPLSSVPCRSITCGSASAGRTGAGVSAMRLSIVFSVLPLDVDPVGVLAVHDGMQRSAGATGLARLYDALLLHAARARGFRRRRPATARRRRTSGPLGRHLKTIRMRAPPGRASVMSTLRSLLKLLRGDGPCSQTAGPGSSRGSEDRGGLPATRCPSREYGSPR